jgi:hypothetical protein
MEHIKKDHSKMRAAAREILLRLQPGEYNVTKVATTDVRGWALREEALRLQRERHPGITVIRAQKAKTNGAIITIS